MSRLEEIRGRRADILRVAARNGAANVRVFGSVARGEERPDSDIDLLVDITADVHGLAYFGLLEDLRRDLAASIGRPVDVVDSGSLGSLRERILQEAVPL